MSQTPKGQPISRSLYSEFCPSLYPSKAHTSLSLYTVILSISPVDFLSCNIFGRGAVRNCYVRSIPLVCRRNIPQIILSLNVSNSQSQAPSQLTFSISENRKAENSGGDDTPAESSINTIPGDQKMASAFLPRSRGDLETLTSSSEAFISQPGHPDKTRTGAKALHLLFDMDLSNFFEEIILRVVLMLLVEHIFSFRLPLALFLPAEERLQSNLSWEHRSEDRTVYMTLS